MAERPPEPPYNPDEPILRGEYEERHAALQNRYVTYARRSTRILAALVAISLVTGGVSAYLLYQNSQQTDEITSSLIEGCQSSGNSLRAVIRKFGRNQIQQIQTDQDQSDAFARSGAFAKLFPGLTEQELNVLLESARKNNEHRIADIEESISEVEPIDCEERYKTK